MQMAEVRVHLVFYVFDEDDGWGNEQAIGVPLAICLAPDEAAQDRARREAAGGPPWPHAPRYGRYVLGGPWNLAAVVADGVVSPELAAELVRRAEGGRPSAPLEIAPPARRAPPGVLDARLRAAPLTTDEQTRAKALRVWLVWYEDRFHMGSARDGFPLTICLSADEAAQDRARRIESGESKPVAAGSDGIEVLGPWSLSDVTSAGPDTVREALRRAAAGLPGPIPVPL